jgi:hypothetical protein
VYSSTVIVPNSGNGRSSCCRCTVAPLIVLPGSIPVKGLGTLAVRNDSVALSRLRDPDKYWNGMLLMARLTGRSVPRDPT